jgi:hypothetical protein
MIPRRDCCSYVEAGGETDLETVACSSFGGWWVVVVGGGGVAVGVAAEDVSTAWLKIFPRSVPLLCWPA